MTDDNTLNGYVRDKDGMLVHVDNAKIRKELDAFIDYVLTYAKKHNLGYVMAVSKHMHNIDKYAVADSWWAPNDTDLCTMTRCLVKGEGGIPSALLYSFTEEIKERISKEKQYS